MFKFIAPRLIHRTLNLIFHGGCVRFLIVRDFDDPEIPFPVESRLIPRLDLGRPEEKEGEVAQREDGGPKNEHVAPSSYRVLKMRAISLQSYKHS